MKKAVITRLMGGLGNQMFQYAAGKALAQKNNVPLLFDRSFLDQRGKNIKYTIRDFELDVYNLQTQFATSGEIEKAMRIENSLLLRKFSDKFSRLVTNP